MKRGSICVILSSRGSILGDQFRHYKPSIPRSCALGKGSQVTTALAAGAAVGSLASDEISHRSVGGVHVNGVFKHGKYISTVSDTEKKTLADIFFLLCQRCVPGKGAQKGPKNFMNSLVNHVAQHEYHSTLSTYGCEPSPFVFGQSSLSRPLWKMVTWKEYPERWARPTSQRVN